MDFAHPKWLWLLALVPLLAAWVVTGARRRARDWSALGQGVRLLGDGAAWWLGAIACLIVALGQPRWGRAPGPPTPPGHDIVLLVDVSRSMAVEDAVPSRLDAAIEMAEDLVRALGREPGNRMAVVAFAGRGVVRRHLTENLGAVSDALRRSGPGASGRAGPTSARHRRGGRGLRRPGARRGPRDRPPHRRRGSRRDLDLEARPAPRGACPGPCGRGRRRRQGA